MFFGRTIRALWKSIDFSKIFIEISRPLCLDFSSIFFRETVKTVSIESCRFFVIWLSDPKTWIFIFFARAIRYLSLDLQNILSRYHQAFKHGICKGFSKDNQRLKHILKKDSQNIKRIFLKIFRKTFRALMVFFFQFCSKDCQSHNCRTFQEFFN